MTARTWNVRGAAAAALVGIAGLAMGIPALQAFAAESPGSVEAAHEAFEQGRFPWYDAEQDSLKPLTLRPSTPAAKPSEFDAGFLRYLAWGVLSLALAALVTFFAYTIRHRLRRQADPQKAAGVVNLTTVESLPFLSGRSRDDLLGEARRYYQEGNYSEAIVYLFSHQLVELDRFALIRIAKGKTNRQYLRELGPAPPLRPTVELTMTAFEDVFFGRRSLDRAGFEACWNQLPLFEQLVSRGGT
jgi:hypothetical protein